MSADPVPRSSPGPATRWPTPGVALGGDDNPEQWPPEVRAEDVRLMHEAGVTVPASGHDLVTERACDGSLTVPAGGCALVREA